MEMAGKDNSLTKKVYFIKSLIYLINMIHLLICNLLIY